MIRLKKKIKDYYFQFEVYKNDKKHKTFNKKNYINKDFQKELIASMTNILDMYDPYTEGHSTEVARLSKEIAKEMKLSAQEIDICYWSGLVHDIGKIMVPKKILNKPGPLTDDEYNQIKKHPVWSYETLNNSERLKHIAKYILHHHERWDGKGYPENLKKNDIPLISQILAVADSWHAMRSDRPHRDALSFHEALEEIEINAGAQFSPVVTNEFFGVLNKLAV